MNKVQQALAIVTTMTKPERQSLLDHLALEVTSTKKSNLKHDRDVELWLMAVTDALDSILRSGGSSGSGIGMVKRTWNASSSSYEQFNSFMVRSKLQELNVAARSSCYGLLAELLVKHASFVAHKSGAPLSPKLVFNCLPNLAGLFDNAFPGYLEGGLAKAVVLSRIKGTATISSPQEDLKKRLKTSK